MKLSAINVHPLKSGAIRPVSSASVTLGGLQDDRTWMVVDAAGDLVTARELPALFRIVADTPATDSSVTAALRLAAPGLDPLEVSHPVSGPVAVRMFTRPAMQAAPAGPEADEFVRRATGRDDLRLVWCADPTQRTLNPEFSQPDDYTAFADGYPVTIVSQASLDQLNEWIAESGGAALPMQRFRPNLVVEGTEPFAEDDWKTLRIGDVECRVVKSVDRCVMTTIDAETLDKGPEPIRTLAKHRKWDGKTWFARHLIPDTEGVISVGDELRVRG